VFTELLGEVKTAFEAELRCRKMGGHVAFFDNEQEWQDYLAAVGDFQETWIGKFIIDKISTAKAKFFFRS